MSNSVVTAIYLTLGLVAISFWGWFAYLLGKDSEYYEQRLKVRRAEARARRQERLAAEAQRILLAVYWDEKDDDEAVHTVLSRKHVDMIQAWLRVYNKPADLRD